MNQNIKNLLCKTLPFAIAVLCIKGFYDTASIYWQFKLPYGIGIHTIPSHEITIYGWFIFYGLLTTAALSIGLSQLKLTDKLISMGYSWFAEPKKLLVILTGLVFVGTVVFRLVILLDAPICDDESTYVFIAKTLLHGRLVNPVPEDKEFYTNQFIIMNHMGWFGKYPIGHPLILAIGELLNITYLIGPVLTSLSFVFAFLIGKKYFSPLETCIGALLLTISPHFIFTGATLVSQTSSTLCLSIGFWASIKTQEEKRFLWAITAGAAWAAALLVRPLPGALFVVTVGLVFIFQKQQHDTWSKHLKKSIPLLLAAALPVVIIGLLFLGINKLQTGEYFTSGYQAFHGKSMGVGHDAITGQISLSVFGGLLRQNIWLLGWPCSLAFVLAARSHKRSLVLFAGFIGAEYVYRLIAPKTVVSTTGPVYLTEIVPLLAFATGSGIVQFTKWIQNKGFNDAPKKIAALVFASVIFSFLCFWPIQLRSIYEGQKTWKTPYTLIEATNPNKKILVFANRMLNSKLRQSWAYFPPNPSPALDDDIIFVRAPEKSALRKKILIHFWQKHYPDRTAWFLEHESDPPQILKIQLPAD